MRSLFLSIHPPRITALVTCLIAFAAGDTRAAWTPLSNFSAAAPGTGLHGTDGWIVGPSGQNLLIAADPTDAAARVLAITSSGSYRTAHQAASLAASANGTLYFRLRIPSGSGDGVDVSFGLTQIENPGEQNTPVTTLRVNNTSLQIHDGVAFKTTATLLRDTWYECWIVIDNPNDRYEVFLRSPSDSAPVPQTASGTASFAFRGGTGNEPMRRFQLRANSAHAGKILHLADVWFDPAARVLTAPASSPPPDDDPIGDPPDEDSPGDDPPVHDGTYASFKAAHFGPDIQKSAAPWADANRDGLPNLLNFAFGRDPLGEPSSPPWAVSLESPVPGQHDLVLRFPRNPGAHVNLTAEWSPNLAPGSWSTSGVSILNPNTDSDLHRAVLPLAAGAPSAFLRLRAELPAAATPFVARPGYKGIWFTLNQFSTYGDKYSGGLGTYTSSHTPMAIYAPQANKTFFTYGGTRSESERQLEVMIGAYDHATGLVSRPTLVYFRNWVDDPHDNASLALDEEGHVWLFVSGRNTTREARFFRSLAPFAIDAFEDRGSAIGAYPQPHWFENEGFLHLFTKYVGGGRHLFWNTGRNGPPFTPDQPLASIGGHYQTSARHGSRVGTGFNRHPGGNADKRTDLYYLQTDNRGASWQTAAGLTVTTPLTTAANPALVRDYASDGRLVYLQDMTFDAAGRPAILYVTSAHHQPGPDGGPRAWEIAHWQDTHWVFRTVAYSTHNYDVGFLRIEADGLWRIMGPTEAGPQAWGTGGEIALWESTDHGATWAKTRDLTTGSVRNHGYVRHPVNAHPDFYAYWADGHTGQFSRSCLYFANRDGTRVFRLPYSMPSATAAPELMP